MKPSFTQSLLCALRGIRRPGIPRGGATLPRVIIQTELGDIEVDIDTVHAPITGRQLPPLRGPRVLSRAGGSIGRSGRTISRTAR